MKIGLKCGRSCLVLLNNWSYVFAVFRDKSESYFVDLPNLSMNLSSGTPSRLNTFEISSMGGIIPFLWNTGDSNASSHRMTPSPQMSPGISPFLVEILTSRGVVTFGELVDGLKWTVDECCRVGCQRHSRSWSDMTSISQVEELED